MNILGTQYTLSTKAFEIYIAGCSGKNGRHCKNCHNPETWNYNQGDVYDNTYFNKMKNKIDSFNSIIDKIQIFGGEPLDRPLNEILELLFDIRIFNKEIWLFTRYEFDEVPKDIKNICDYIKCGEYNEELKCNDNIQYGLKLATSNQHIYKKGEEY